MTNYFAELFRYDAEQNQRLLDRLKEMTNLDERTQQVLGHILVAKKVWIARLRGQNTSNIELWPHLSWDEAQNLAEENEKAYADFLSGLSGEDLQKEAVYTNSKGREFHTPVRDVLMHVLIHSGYHRGQIAKAVRKQGGEPINTDYIMHVRAQMGQL